MYTTLAMLKRHLNVDKDFSEDDEYILYLYEVAEAAVQVNLCVALEDLEDEHGKLPAPVVHAIMLLVGEMYNNREINAYGVSVTPTSHNFDYLLDLYHNYADTTSQAFYNEVLNDIISRLEIEESTGRLVLHQDPEYYVGLRGRAQKRLEEELLVEAGRLYMKQNS